MATTRRAVAQLARLPRLRLVDLPQFVTLTEHERHDPRLCPQGGATWRRERRERLTASQFAAMLGFGTVSRHRASRMWRAIAERSNHCGTGDDDEGSRYGLRYERSALATYLVAVVLPRCRTARLLETGFWPISAPEGVQMGSSPDALLEDVDAWHAGGVMIEAKCPFRAGAPRAHCSVPIRMIPQIQGGLLATGRAECHLVSWSPSGATVFRLASDVEYQEAMMRALVDVMRAGSEQRPLGTHEEALCADVRRHSVQLADAAILLAKVDAADCLLLEPRHEMAGSRIGAADAIE